MDIASRVRTMDEQNVSKTVLIKARLRQIFCSWSCCPCFLSTQKYLDLFISDAFMEVCLLAITLKVEVFLKKCNSVFIAYIAFYITLYYIVLYYIILHYIILLYNKVEYLQVFIMICILANTSFMAMEHHLQPDSLEKMLEIGNYVSIHIIHIIHSHKYIHT